MIKVAMAHVIIGVQMVQVLWTPQVIFLFHTDVVLPVISVVVGTRPHEKVHCVIFDNSGRDVKVTNITISGSGGVFHKNSSEVASI